MHHRREIEGLRALAIIPVVLFHAGIPGWSGGFVGVDIFFVISGFLITTTILEDHAVGRFTFAGFYERRARRLLPALLLLLLASAVVAALLFIDEDLRKFGQATAASALFGANLLFAREVGYFDDVEGFQPLIHLWSLAVEEQFYLLFPPAVMLLLRRRPGWLAPSLSGAFVLSFGLALATVESHAQWAFYLLPTRAWELLAGALCATIARSPRPAQVPAAIGLALIALGYALIDPTTPAPGPAFAVPVLGAALVLLFATPQTLAGRVLSLGPLPAIGAASYGIYLWHNPLFGFLRYAWFGPVPWQLTALAVALSFALGFASLHLIETPVRTRKLLPSRKALVMFCIPGIAIAVAFGAAAHFRLLPAKGPANAAAMVPDEVLPDGALSFVLYGDSHARQYYPAMTERFGQGALLGQSACLSLPGSSNLLPTDSGGPACIAMADRLVDLARRRHVTTVYWAQRWERDLLSTATGASLGSTSSDGLPELLTGIDRMRRRLPAGTRLVLIGNVPTALAAGPVMSGGYLRCRAFVNEVCPTAFPSAQAEARGINRALAAYAATHPGVAFVETAGVLCAGPLCPLVVGGSPVYADHTHLTPRFARQVVSRFPSP